MSNRKLKTSLGDMLGIEYPIVLAGMGSRGKATPPALVAAVSEAGGLGVLGGAGLPAEVLRQAIRSARSLTRKPIGVDLLLVAPILSRKHRPHRAKGRQSSYSCGFRVPKTLCLGWAACL